MVLNIEQSNSLLNVLTGKSDVYDYQLHGNYYNIIMFKVFTPKTHLKLELKYLKEAKKRIELHICDTLDIIKIQWSMDEILLLVVGDSKEELDTIKDRYIGEILNIMNSYRCLRYFGSVGKMVSSVLELPLSFHEANRAYVYRFIWDNSVILDYKSIPVSVNDMKVSSSKKVHEFATFDKKKVEAFLNSGRIEEVDIFVVEYLKSIGKTNMDSFLFRQYIVLDTYFISTNYIDELGYDGELIEKPLGKDARMMLSVMSYDFMKEYLIRIFTQGISLRDEYYSIYKI